MPQTLRKAPQLAPTLPLWCVGVAESMVIAGLGCCPGQARRHVLPCSASGRLRNARWGNRNAWEDCAERMRQLQRMASIRINVGMEIRRQEAEEQGC
jgi:hypothetical protein